MDVHFLVGSLIFCVSEGYDEGEASQHAACKVKGPNPDRIRSGVPSIRRNELFVDVSSRTQHVEAKYGSVEGRRLIGCGRDRRKGKF